MHLIPLESLTRRYFALRPAIGTGAVNFRTSLITTATYLAIPLIICFAAHIDGTWWMRGGGKGFFQHYGMLTIFTTTPIIVILTALALQKFRLTMDGLHNYTFLGTVPPDLEKLVAWHVRSLSLRKQSAWLFVLFCLIGFLFGVANIVQTISPVKTYGNDVFDAIQYPYGFYFTKLYLCLIWTFSYPVALFIALHITISLVIILRYMCRHDLLRIDFFHPDNCGGVSIFGSINLLVMTIYANFFAVLYMLHVTHATKTYLTVTVPWFGLSFIFIIQSFGAVYHIHKFAAIKRNESLQMIGAFLNTQMLNLLTEKKFSADLIHARNHLLGLKTYPYAGPALAVVNAIRYVPAIVAVAKLFIP